MIQKPEQDLADRTIELEGGLFWMCEEDETPRQIIKKLAAMNFFLGDEGAERLVELNKKMPGLKTSSRLKKNTFLRIRRNAHDDEDDDEDDEEEEGEEEEEEVEEEEEGRRRRRTRTLTMMACLLSSTACAIIALTPWAGAGICFALNRALEG